MSLDLKQLEQFRVVARLEHVTTAAAALGLSQPALSRSLARLQHDLGIALFEQAGRSIRLTAAGAVFLRHVERMLREFRDANLEMAEAARGASSVVQLGFLRSLAPDVPTLVSSFRSAHPAAQFVFRQVRASEWEDQLAAGDVDLCLALAPINRADISWKPTFNQELWLSVPSGHALGRRTSVSVRQLAAEVFVSYRRGHGTRDVFDQLCSSAGFSPRIAYEGDDTTCLLAFIAAGFGAAILPDHLKWPGVIDVRLADPGARRRMGLAWVSDRYASPTAKAFRQFVFANAAAKA